jgi:hypothetical protein
MRFKGLICAAVGFAFLLPSIASAQRGTRLAPAPRAAAVHRGSSFNNSPVRTSRRGAIRSNNSFFSNSLDQVSFFPSNGLGINGINTIATQDIGIQAAIDPATQWRLALAERVARNGAGVFPGGGYYLLGGGGYPYPADYSDNEGSEPQQGQPQQQQPPQVIVVQQAPAQQSPSAFAEQPAESAPLPDVGQFTLVLRNGSRIEAVAFSRVQERVVYITQDGSRKTLSLSDLDVDATVRLNQERGTPLQLPL